MSFFAGEEVRIFQDEDVEAAARVLAGLRRPERASPHRPGQQRHRHRRRDRFRENDSAHSVLARGRVGFSLTLGLSKP